MVDRWGQPRDKHYPKTKRMPDGGVGYHVGSGQYIASPKYRYSIRDRGYVRIIRRTNDVNYDISNIASIPQEEQPQTPENPGIRKESYSTYGISIPISAGRRAVAGNVIDATDLTPVLIGYKVTVTEITVPVYLDDTGPE